MLADEPEGPLRGLRVLELGQLIAAPLASALLADFGADVVKVEKPRRGDPVRELALRKNGVSVWQKVSNRNKRSIALDLKDPEDRVLLLHLAAKADVLIENFAPGTMERLGIGFPELQAVNHGLVLLSISGYGQTGPYRSKTGFGRNAEAIGGFAYLNGHADRPPIHAGVPIADSVSGVFGAMAVMMAIYERDRNPDGAGQHIDLALYESIVRILEFVPIVYDQLGIVTERQGATNAYVAPVNTWRTADGKWLSFTGSTQATVERLFKALEMPELIDDPRFVDNEARIVHRDELDEIIGGWFAEHAAADACRVLDEHQVAIARTYSVADMFADDHFRARSALVDVADEQLGGSARVQGVVPKFSRTPGSVRYLGRPLDGDRSSVISDWLG